MVPYLISAGIGLMVGRYLSVVVATAPDGPVAPSLSRPPCGCRPRWWDLLPVAGWIRYRTRRPQCRYSAGITLLLVELIGAGVFVAAFHFVGPVWSLPAYLWFVSVTTALGFIDLGHRLIPNRILVPGVAVGLVLLSGGATLDGRAGELPEALASGFGYFLLMLLAAFATRGAIGMGDVKLAFLLGLFAGYGEWRVAVLAGAGAFLLAGVAALVLVGLRILRSNDHVPFGPFMVLGAWLAIAAHLATGGGLF